MKKDSKGNIDRRRFIGTGLMAAAALTIVPRHVLGRGFLAPSDMITLGFIGTGKQARYLVTEFVRRARVIAGCDVYAAKLDRFKAITEALHEKAGLPTKGFKSYVDFRELLANKEIDAVVVATPDHWHAINVIEAAKAGKDIFCEKPYSHSIREGRLMVKAVERHGRINQTGNMQRSLKNFRNACRLVRAGYIGEVKEIKVCVGPPPKQYDLPPEPLPAGLDWELWIGPAEYNEFNSELAPPLERDVYPNWRNYSEYGAGMTADWGAHMFDIAQWALGKDAGGPIAVYPPGKEHKHLTFVYDNGTTMTHEDFNRGNAVRFIGTQGVIDISRGFFETMPDKLAGHEFTDKDVKLYESDDHYQNWLDCIKSRKQPISTAEIGHRTATVCFLANIAYELKRPLFWNPTKEEFIHDHEANSLRSTHVRKPWSLHLD